MRLSPNYPALSPRLAGVAHQQERRPVVGMGVFLPEARYSQPKALTLRLSLGQMAIEVPHEIRRRPVIDVPQADQDGRGARVKESTDKSQ